MDVPRFGRADRLAPEAQALVRVPGGDALTALAPTLRVLAPRFLAWFAYVRERSHNTVTAYTFDLAVFVDFAENAGLVYPDQIRVQHLEMFCAWMRQTRKLKASSVNRHIHALRSFWKWMQREELATRNPAADVALLKVPRRLPVFLSIAEQERMLTVLAAQASARPYVGRRGLPGVSIADPRLIGRDYALIATAILTGLRVGELGSLRLDEIDLDAGVLRVVGKGNKQREGVIIPRLAAILRHYVTTVRPALLARRPSEYLFLTDPRYGVGGRGAAYRADGPIEPRVLYQMIRTRLEPILHRPVNPHMLRHSFGSRLREHDAPIELVQEAMGHANIQTTMIYAHLSGRKRKADIARYLEGGAQ